MKTIMMLVIVVMLGTVSWAHALGDYQGDERCPPPKDWSDYSEPFDPSNNPTEYPNFYKSDWPGWFCSYQRDDGVIVQYGDSRSPRQQWLDMYGGDNDQNN